MRKSSLRVAISALTIVLVGACASEKHLAGLSPEERDSRQVELAAMKLVGARYGSLPLLFDPLGIPGSSTRGVRDSAWSSRLATTARARRVFKDSVIRCGDVSTGKASDGAITDQDCMMAPGYRLALLGAPSVVSDTASIALELWEADSSRWAGRASRRTVTLRFARKGKGWQAIE
jgi:hypothetical protein